MFVAGVDGCRAGWVCFKVEVTSLATSLTVIDLRSLLQNRPSGLACLGIDIPIGLLDGSRACDKAARKLLGPRRDSVFPAPCRSALRVNSYVEGSAANRRTTGRGLSQQAWGIAPKIKEVDDAITPESQQWAFEIHPEVSFWALNGQRPMAHNKKSKEGAEDRLALLRTVFPEIEHHLLNRPSRVGVDDLVDAGAAAWTAFRRHQGNVGRVCEPERDKKGLEVTIYY